MPLAGRQSNQAGIERGRPRRGPGLSSPGANRTKLGLKAKVATHARFLEEARQSNQAGIESGQNHGGGLYPPRRQSNQAGIESILFSWAVEGSWLAPIEPSWD